MKQTTTTQQYVLSLDVDELERVMQYVAADLAETRKLARGTRLCASKAAREGNTEGAASFSRKSREYAADSRFLAGLWSKLYYSLPTSVSDNLNIEDVPF